MELASGEIKLDHNGIFVKFESINPARLPPHLECISYLYITVLLTNSFVETALWKLKVSVEQIWPET